MINFCRILNWTVLRSLADTEQDQTVPGRFRPFPFITATNQTYNVACLLYTFINVAQTVSMDLFQRFLLLTLLSELPTSCCLTPVTIYFTLICFIVKWRGIFNHFRWYNSLTENNILGSITGTLLKVMAIIITYCFNLSSLQWRIS